MLDIYIYIYIVRQVQVEQLCCIATTRTYVCTSRQLGYMQNVISTGANVFYV